MPEAFSYAFVQRALVAVLLAAPLLGGLSPLVVGRRLAFFSAALGQAVLTGVALGVLLGEPLETPWASVFGFSLLVGLSLVFLRRRSSLPPDTLVGVLLAFTLGLGVCLLVVVTKRFNVHQLEAVMFGSVLTVTEVDLALLAAALLVVAAVVGPRHNALLLDSLDSSLAAAQGVRGAALEYVFVAALTCAIVVSVKVMGALMVEALLVVPAAAARNVTRSLASLTLVSILVALLSGVGGVALSTVVNVPSGAAIVLLLALLFLLLLLVGRTSPCAAGRARP